MRRRLDIEPARRRGLVSSRRDGHTARRLSALPRRVDTVCAHVHLWPQRTGRDRRADHPSCKLDLPIDRERGRSQRANARGGADRHLAHGRVADRCRSAGLVVRDRMEGCRDCDPDRRARWCSLHPRRPAGMETNPFHVLVHARQAPHRLYDRPRLCRVRAVCGRRCPPGAGLASGDGHCDRRWHRSARAGCGPSASADRSVEGDAVDVRRRTSRPAGSAGPLSS